MTTGNDLPGTFELSVIPGVTTGGLRLAKQISRAYLVHF